MQRQYKPIGSLLFNFPADYVDAISSFDLRCRSDFVRAQELVEQIPIDEGETIDRHRTRLDRLHLAMWRVLDETPVIELKLTELATERDKLATELQLGWSDHHERKANNYLFQSPDFTRPVHVPMTRHSPTE